MGGGEKGMKIVEEENQLENLFLTAKNEAKKYFGNDELYIEKYFKIQDILRCKLCRVKIKLCTWGREIVQFNEDTKN